MEWKWGMLVPEFVIQQIIAHDILLDRDKPNLENVAARLVWPKTDGVPCPQFDGRA